MAPEQQRQQSASKAATGGGSSGRGVVPRRPYGPTVHRSNNLPPTLPIVGLGCSSFSTFFLRDGDDDGQTPPPPPPPTTFPPDPDHPVVQNWIETIGHAVVDRGINLLDTAPWYGHGTSEVVIGYAMERMLLPDDDDDDDGGGDDEEESKGDIGGDGDGPTSGSNTHKRIRRRDVVINTKVGRYESDPRRMFDFSAKRVRSSVLTSIERMKCRYVDVLQLHDPEYAPNLDLLVDETIPAMAALRAEGLVRAIGMTGYPLDVQRTLIDRSRVERGIEFDQSLTYCHYNLHDQSLFRSSDDVGKSLDLCPPPSPGSFASFCESNHIGLIAAAPLSMGLLTRRGPPAWHPAGDALKRACREAASYCQDQGINISSLALLFALGQDRIPCTIVGMKDVDEVDRAADVAMRFAGCQGEAGGGGGLEGVMDPTEKRVLTALLNSCRGPFADLVASGGGYRWDGRAEADRFWEGVPGGKEEAEKVMRGG